MKKTVMELRNQKIELRRILAYSIIMGISINFISGSLGKLLSLPLWLSLIIWIGIALTIIVISQIIELRRLDSSIKFDCLFITNESEKNKPIEISNYKISKDMTKYLQYSFSENHAFKTIWETSGLDKIEGPCVSKITNESKALVTELIEYCVLVHFSTFVCDYYNSREITKKTMKYSRNDIPDVLLKNRFLRLFSEEPKNRASFFDNPKGGVYMIDEVDADSKDKRTLVYMISSNGTMFRRFDLIMPKGSKVFRKNDNSIVIDTKLFTLKYTFVFDNMSTFVEREFYKYYLHMPIDSKFHDWKFNIDVDIKYKITALVKIWDWKYYDWLDEYIERLSEYCDVEQFYKSIGWNEAKTILRILNTSKYIRNKD